MILFSFFIKFYYFTFLKKKKTSNELRIVEYYVKK